LGCHGKSIDPEVKAKLDELYPEDQATGFSEGDLRGAFVVTRQTTGQ
ncbi:MAG: c-type heme family protein, partial [Pseudomonadota bacterium]